MARRSTSLHASISPLTPVPPVTSRDERWSLGSLRNHDGNGNGNGNGNDNVTEQKNKWAEQ